MQLSQSKDYPGVQLEEIKVDDDLISQELNVNESGYCQVIQKPVHSSISYRPDIDGLRAVAITLVVVYHAYPDKLPGGFIGVDIFFVISGYLISQILIKQINNNKFSYKDFYCRRVKRIFPAFLTVLFVTVCIAAVFSNDYQANTTINTLEASLVFSANILTLFSQQGYFDPDIRTNPLLHLWSLGVEEQFYIIWPWLMFVVLKVFTPKSTLVLAGYAGLSFLISIVAIYFSPKFAFYFPFCRFWQMAVGGILAHLNFQIKNPTINNVLSFTAVLAILITTFIINEQSLFPGFWALIPTFGSAFIIQAKGQALLNKHVLSNRLFLFIGKISYSLYLWHWPLLVFSRTFYPQGSTSIFSNTLFILFLTVVLSILTYYFIENPVRLIKKNKVVVVLLILAIVLGSLGFALKIILPRLAPSDQSIIAMLKQAQHNMIPTADDYVERNGRKHPNLSKNKNRQKTTSQKLRIPYFDQKYDYSHFDQENLLEKDIDSSSVFYRKQLPQLKHFVVANEGRSNKFLLVGDSHSLKLSYRFQQLFYESRERGELDKFPTAVGLVRYGMLGGESDEINEFLLDFVREHKFQRVLIANHLLPRWCKDTNTYFDEQPICDMAKADSYNKYVLGMIERLRANGASVSVIAVDIEHPLLHPQKMADVFLQPIQANIQPFKYSDFRRKYSQVIDKWETTMKNANVPVIDIADNLCWEDLCQKFTPLGYPAYQDNNHISKFYSRHWVSAVDHLVEF